MLPTVMVSTNAIINAILANLRFMSCASFCLLNLCQEYFFFAYRSYFYYNTHTDVQVNRFYEIFCCFGELFVEIFTVSVQGSF